MCKASFLSSCAPQCQIRFFACVAITLISIIAYIYHGELLLFQNGGARTHIVRVSNESAVLSDSVYQHRSRLLNKQCHHLGLYPNVTYNLNTSNAAFQNDLTNFFILVLRRYSMIYCGVPKVATKTLLTIMFYAHLSDINDHLKNNWTNIDSDEAKMEQRLNFTILVQGIRSVC